MLTMKPKIDRISGLPDSIITHILSFLDTRTAVRTSALSKRWRLIWTSLPALDFYYPSVNPLFTPFVHKVLSLRDNSHLISLRFSVVVDVDPNLVEKCVNYAFGHNVEKLKVRAFCSRRSVELPQLLGSHSLRVLKLTNATATSIALPKSLGLPGLKTLHLKNFAFSEQNYNGEMFSGCPNLETLVLCKCSIRARDKLKVFNISGLKLRNLEILYWRCPWAYHFDQSIEISSPGLACFKYKGQVCPLSITEELHCVDKVYIDLWSPSACGTIDEDERKLWTGENVVSLLGKLCNLKSLTLSLRTIEILGAIPDLQVLGSSTFGNLRYLRFKAEHGCAELNLDINTTTNLLKSSDCDRNLSLDLPPAKKRARCKPVDLVEIPSNVLSYLLLSSPCAEKLVIEFPEETDE